MRPKRLYEYLRKVIRASQEGKHLPVYIEGDPGVGKSDIVRQAAQAEGYKVIDLRLLLLDPTDIRGFPVPDMQSKTAVWLNPTFLPNVERDGELVVVFYDEIRAALPATQSSAFQLILDRRVGEYVLPPKCVQIAAGNPDKPGVIAHKMAWQLKNRFDHISLEPNLDDFSAWALENGIDFDVLGFLKYRGEAALFNFDPSREAKTYASPRSWAMASRIKDIFAGDMELMSEGIRGAVGDGIGSEFMAHLRLKDRMPDIEAIVAGNSKKVPKEPDIKYVTLTSVAGRVKTQKEVNSALRYSMEYDGDFAVLLYQMMMSRVRDYVDNSDALADWADRFKGVLV